HWHSHWLDHCLDLDSHAQRPRWLPDCGRRHATFSRSHGAVSGPSLRRHSVHHPRHWFQVDGLLERQLQLTTEPPHRPLRPVPAGP
ncbi:hypothetical protein BN1708_020646, partial [Verticillium longisporum]